MPTRKLPKRGYVGASSSGSGEAHSSNAQSRDTGEGLDDQACRDSLVLEGIFGGRENFNFERRAWRRKIISKRGYCGARDERNGLAGRTTKPASAIQRNSPD